MPWSVTTDHPDCDAFAVVKTDDGSLVACHTSEADALAQVAALYAAEAEGESEPEADGARAAARPGLRRLPDAVAARLADRSLEQVTVVRGGRPVDVRRLKAQMEVRDADGDGAAARVVGYASVFEVPYSVYGGPEYGGWTETIAPGAFRRTLRERADVRLLLNHDGIPLARTRSGTMRLEDDQVGLFVDADLDLRSSMAKDVTVAMRRGDLDEMSFAFEVLADEWSPDFMTRRINEVRLYDVSLVTYPASGAASAYLASELDAGDGGEPSPDLEAASAAGRGLSLSQALAQRDRVLVGR